MRLLVFFTINHLVRLYAILHSILSQALNKNSFAFSNGTFILYNMYKSNISTRILSMPVKHILNTSVSKKTL